MPKNKPREEKKPIGERISALLARTIRFVTYDIWRITENEVSGLKEIYINIIKTVILAVRGFQSENLQTKASALTYSTLLSIVPLLAVLLGIAKGFGFQGTVRQELFDYFPGHEMELNKAFEFVESYLAQAQRVAIARALVNNPSVIIADEPTGNLDPARSLEIMMLLEQINALGTTVLVVTHERELVNRFTKRVVAINEGRIISDGMDGYYLNEEE